VIAGLRPGPEPPFGLPERLRTLDPRLGLLFLRDGRWAITHDWRPDDPRRALIQAGTHSPRRAFDILCILPADCPLESAPSYLEVHLRRAAQSADVAALLARIADANARARQQILQPTLELAEELVAANAKTLFSREGKHLPRTRLAPSRIDRDAKRLRDFFHDTNTGGIT
jgi:hypothetical protein